MSVTTFSALTNLTCVCDVNSSGLSSPLTATVYPAIPVYVMLIAAVYPALPVHVMLTETVYSALSM